ncbi:MAG: succinyl-diaminopimelate desuccinylase [Rhodobacterales bacterium]|nr:MAG: succinyl-diaminopimelate desuccinylase [Rhodobacterales bacterium]
MTHAPTDPVALTRDLIRCPSVTPEEGGALQLLEAVLSEAGFTCTRVDRNGTPNLFARFGEKGAPRTLGFNGHTDVVPVGDEAAWSVDPFGAEERDGKLWGRGAVDMKSGVAAFVAAAVDYARAAPQDAALILTITGDEEGGAADGTVALLDWMQANGEAMTDCLVGEPTCPTTFGEMMKIGRRGSLNCWITATGQQGHAAYPHRARNPLPPLLRLLDRLAHAELDQGTEHFDPSTLAVVSVDVGNAATNVIPAEARGLLNIRFNDAHTGAALTEWLHEEAAKAFDGSGVEVALNIKVSGESFLTQPKLNGLSDLITLAVKAETGLEPKLSTSGGTSDARFMKDHCPVVEFGLVGQTMHAVDERVEIAQIDALKRVYARVIESYFA